MGMKRWFAIAAIGLATWAEHKRGLKDIQNLEEAALVDTVRLMKGAASALDKAGQEADKPLPP